ncbi:SulP family inorganic anion transporter [Legionella israelensis]|uniref:Sulfate transporter n=1 Tax=Legionella israelensis TaxID=454 RepID=A0A0W0WC20_9GAMM|nr:SulP family inorganic anion transporter [Legionella israelensis]KTD29899.1 sulfate transporter [Legionella israelensis]QBS10307.1 SulP family inorganic anion transporter [Legionella israelensis]SCY49699.1 sulfate permease, SulP family [Legionella israelensis DSM 19235]STX59907.1 sulfate transporter [Legionella israelensis]
MLNVLKEISFKRIQHDLPASIVVFFVALPLCLGIALASGAPLFSGIISGVIGGIVVGIASGSNLGVSGPAAGLVVIVLLAIESLGSWPAFLVSVVLAGCFQLFMGYAKAGFIAYFFPSSVIKGMLTGIGLLIILKQIPYALGFDPDTIGDLSSFQFSIDITINYILNALNAFNNGAIFISFVSLAILILWDTVLIKKNRFFQIIQAPIVVVIVGILLNKLYQIGFWELSLGKDNLVQIPVAESVLDFLKQLTHPDFSALKEFTVWKIAVVLAIVASLETLLCVEATDKLDPHKRITPVNRELKAQGLGNVISGLLGGLPLTQVIIRSSANINFGGKTKLSTILHGIFLLISAAILAPLINMIPLSSLAAILIIVGYKLAKPTLFKKMYQLGSEQFMPFIATVIGILVTDLLRGIIIGIGFGIFFTLKHSYRNAYYMKTITEKENGDIVYHLVLAEEVSFFNKANIMQALDAIPSGSKVIIDCSNSKSIAYDVVELINDFKENAKYKNIEVQTIDFLDFK